MGFCASKGGSMKGKFFIGVGLFAILTGQGMVQFALGLHFFGQLLSLSGIALLGYGA